MRLCSASLNPKSSAARKSKAEELAFLKREKSKVRCTMKLTTLFDWYVRPLGYSKKFDTSKMKWEHNYAAPSSTPTVNLFYDHDGVQIKWKERETWCLDDHDLFQDYSVIVDGQVVVNKVLQ